VIVQLNPIHRITSKEPFGRFNTSVRDNLVHAVVHGCQRPANIAAHSALGHIFNRVGSHLGSRVRVSAAGVRAAT
jgi:hypothetical protein